MRVFKHYIPLSLLFLGISEAMIVFGSVYAVHILKFSGLSIVFPTLTPIYPQAIVIVFFTIITLYVANLYDLRLSRRIGESILKTMLCYISIYLIIEFFDVVFEKFKLENKILILSMLLSLPTIIIFRLAFYFFLRMNGFNEKILVIGANDIAQTICQELKSSNNPNPGYEILGCVADKRANLLSLGEDCKVLGRVEDLQRIIQETFPDTVVVALSERRGTFPAQEILSCKMQGVRIEDWPSFYEKLTGKILIQNLRPSWLIFSDGFERNSLARMAKRLVDMLLAVFGVCVSLPLMVCIAIFTKLDSSGPIIFRQERVGENGKIYTLCKFRTMVVDAEEKSGPVWSQTIDPRVTRLGNILRRTGMDELPQLFNVLKGDMSFVGPRPERPHFVSELQKRIPYYIQRLVVKPGITGWAQVRYGYGATIEDAIEKLQYDLYYIKNMSIFLDFLIMLSTVHKVLFAKVAVQNIEESKQDVSPSPLQGESSDHMAVIDQGHGAVAHSMPEHAVADVSGIEGEF